MEFNMQIWDYTLLPVEHVWDNTILVRKKYRNSKTNQNNR